MNDYFDRDDLLALDIAPADADELLRQTSHTGTGGRPVVEAERLVELLGMIWKRTGYDDALYGRTISS
jgi:hypothetical protein